MGIIMETKSKDSITKATSAGELEALLDRVRRRALSDSDLYLLERVLVLFLKSSVMLQKKKTTIKQLKELLLGLPTDKGNR